jgi:hypothetical protein
LGNIHWAVALKDGQTADTVGDGRRQLEACRARAYHHDTFAGQVDVMVPASSVKRRSGKGFRAEDRRDKRTVELTDGADHRARLQCVE